MGRSVAVEVTGARVPSPPGLRPRSSAAEAQRAETDVSEPAAPLASSLLHKTHGLARWPCMATILLPAHYCSHSAVSWPEHPSGLQNPCFCVAQSIPHLAAVRTDVSWAARLWVSTATLSTVLSPLTLTRLQAHPGTRLGRSALEAVEPSACSWGGGRVWNQGAQ